MPPREVVRRLSRATPRLRGLGETHINVVLDGAFVHNACPSRMDPPTSFP